MQAPTVALSKSGAWVKSLNFFDINAWDIETSRAYLLLNPKLQGLLVRPKTVSLAEVKSFVAKSLYVAICRYQDHNRQRVSTREFDNKIVNALNIQIRMLHQLMENVKLKPICLTTADAFHVDIQSLYSQLCSIQASILDKEKRKQEVEASASTDEERGSAEGSSEPAA
jgi:hypothetical protein